MHEEKAIEGAARDGPASCSLTDILVLILEPGSVGKREEYVFVRRMLLHRQEQKLRRQTWDCNGAGYIAYRKYICSLKHGLDPSLNDSPQGRLSVSSTQGRLSVSSSSKDPDIHKQSFESTVSETKQVQQPAYAFVGMKCIFDNCRSSVNVVRFGHLSSDLLAYGSRDGTLCICSVGSSSRTLHQLKGHLKEITDFDWSLNNHYLCSSSLDKTLRVWDVNEGKCVRVIYDDTPQLCVRFHPVNNNYVVVATARGHLKVINFSTGRQVHKLDLGNIITAIDMDPSGRLLFAGDSLGCIYSIAVDARLGKLSYSHKNSTGLTLRSSTTTLQFRIFSLLAGGPVLLALNRDGSLRFFSVALEVDGYLTLRCALHLSPLARNIKASFCPLLSLEKGEFIVSGSEDKNVYFYDFTRPKHPCVNKLQGHGAPVVGVSWNYGENLLASSDCEGSVIVWERAK